MPNKDPIKRREYEKTYRQNHREEERIRKRKYYQNHKEKEKIRKGKSYLMHREHRKKINKETRRKYYLKAYNADPEKYKERSCEWLKANGWYSILNRKLRDSTLKERTPVWANMKRIKEWYRMAKMITKLSGVKHTVDHIIPLCGDVVCGLHVENNLQILPFSENSSKSNKFVYFAV